MKSLIAADGFHFSLMRHTTNDRPCAACVSGYRLQLKPMLVDCLNKLA